MKVNRIFRVGLVVSILAVFTACESDIFPSVISDLEADSNSGSPAELVVKQGTTGIGDGGSYDYGAVLINSPRDVSFTIENRGEQVLRLTGASEVTLSGADAASYTVVLQPSSSIPGGSESAFTIRLLSTTAGESYDATVTIENDAETDEVFEFDLVGIGVSGTSPGGSIQIGSGDPDYVGNDRQNLYFTVADDVSGFGDIDMMVSNNSDFSGAGWVDYATFLTDWGLANSGTDGTKTVYVKFRDGDGNESVAFSDSTYLDTTGPTGTIQIREGYAYETDSSTYLRFSGSDAGSGIQSMRIANGADPTVASFESLSTPRSWTLTSGYGTKTVSVQFRDELGNLSSPYQDTIIVDDSYESTYGNNWWEDAYDLWTTFPGSGGSVDDLYGDFDSQAYDGIAAQGDDDWYRIYAPENEWPIVQVDRPVGASGNLQIRIYRVDNNDFVNLVTDSGFSFSPSVDWDATGHTVTNYFLGPGYYYILVTGSDAYAEYGLSWYACDDCGL